MKNLLIIFVFTLLLTGCSSKSDKEYFSEAEKNIKENNFTEAVNNFEEMVNKYPESSLAPEALHQSASIYQSKKVKNLSDDESLGKAMELYSRAYEEYPSSVYAPMSLFMIGFIQANEIKDYEAATKTYKLFIDKYPNNELASSAKEELEFMGLSPEEILQKKIAVGEK